jgi:hypothetical protein
MALRVCVSQIVNGFWNACRKAFANGTLLGKPAVAPGDGTLAGLGDILATRAAIYSFSAKIVGYNRRPQRMDVRARFKNLTRLFSHRRL